MASHRLKELESTVARLRVECRDAVAVAVGEVAAARAEVLQCRADAAHESNRAALEFEVKLSGMLPSSVRAALESTIQSLQAKNRALQLRVAM
jgi:hypothetical protein